MRACKLVDESHPAIHMIYCLADRIIQYQLLPAKLSPPSPGRPLAPPPNSVSFRHFQAILEVGASFPPAPSRSTPPRAAANRPLALPALSRNLFGRGPPTSAMGRAFGTRRCPLPALSRCDTGPEPARNRQGTGPEPARNRHGTGPEPARNRRGSGTEHSLHFKFGPIEWAGRRRLPAGEAGSA